MRLSSSKVFQPAATIAAPPIVMAFSANEKSFERGALSSHSTSLRSDKATSIAEYGAVSVSLAVADVVPVD